jgi:hypothetical protein
MKNRYAFLAAVLATCLTSCQKQWTDPPEQTGTLHIDIGLFIRVNDVNQMLKSTLQTEDFRVFIYSSDGTEVLTYDRASDMPEEIVLTTGDYYVAATSDNDLPAAFENPYYYGESEMFTIGSEQLQTVSVTCAMANTMVTVVYSGRTLDSFATCETTVASSLGALVFDREETRAGYFRTLPLNITAVLTRQKADGSEDVRTLTGNINMPLANRHYEIHIDAAAEEGTAAFQILLDDSPLPVEVVELHEGGGQAGPGAIAFGELLITEIMFDPSSLPDNEGEWFEVFNNSDRTLSLQHIIISRDGANQYAVGEAFDLPAGSFTVFKRTEQATGAEGIVYGSAISLTNTGAVLSLYNEGTEDGPGSLIFSVDYGADAFPSATGASISLSPEFTDPVNASLGTSWCASASAYDTGDSGTPGQPNDDCIP